MGAPAAAEEVPTRPNTALVALQATETVLMWGGFLALQIAKTRFNRCTGAYGGLFAAEIVLAVGTSAFFAWQARRSKLIQPLFGSFCAVFLRAVNSKGRQHYLGFALTSLWPYCGMGMTKARMYSQIRNTAFHQQFLAL